MGELKYNSLPIKLVVIFLSTSLLVAPQVKALDLVISENGSDSVSEIIIESQTQTHVEQSNNANFTNDITANADTGNNYASANSGDTSIVTGNIKVDTNV